MTMGQQQVAQDVDGTGRIVVKLTRGQLLRQKVAPNQAARSFDPPEHVDTTASCKAVVQKHGVSHALKYEEPRVEVLGAFC